MSKEKSPVRETPGKYENYLGFVRNENERLGRKKSQNLHDQSYSEVIPTP